MATPLAPIALAFAIGILAAPWMHGGLAWATWAGGLGTAAILLALGRFARAALPLLIAVAALGTLRAAPVPLALDHLATLPLPRAARIEGRLAQEPTQWAPDRTRVLVTVERADDTPRSGLVALTLYGPTPVLGEAQRIVAEARLFRPQGFRNPGGFDQAARLAREGIHVIGSARAEQLRVTEASGPPWTVRVRRAAVAAVERALPPASAALLAGLVLGERGRLPPEIDESFRHAGVYHVLAVSGFNVALVGSATWALLWIVGVGHRLAAMVAIVVIVGFGLMVGLQPSVLRAVIMAGLVLGAFVLERDASVVNSLALAALAILAVRPGDLLEPGFQLSFAATAGIVLAPLPRGVMAGAVGVSVAAQLAVLPIGLSHFNQLSTIAVVANLVAVPLAGLATLVGLLAMVVAFASESVAAPLFDGVWPVLLALRAAAWTAASIPGAVVHLPAPSWPAVACYVAALGIGLAWWRLDHGRRSRALGGLALGLGTGALTLALWPLMRPPDGRLHVAVLDVGQGDAIVIRAPDGRTAVVDAGPGGPYRLDTGERVVAPFLWNHGVQRLAATLVTHADVDHAGGMRAVHRLFNVDERWDRATLAAGPRWLGGVQVTLVHPRAVPTPSGALPSGAGRSTHRNAEAIVLRLDLGLVSVLLASDIGAAQEHALVAADTPLAATVLKVAHHGAASSSTPAFLQSVRPAVAVLSVGARNTYRHPDPAVLGRLAESGASLYRTDRDGGVVLETDGRVLTVTRTVGGETDRYCVDPDTLC